MLTLCHGVLQNTAFDEIAHFTLNRVTPGTLAHGFP